VISIAISPDGQTLVSGSNDQTIKVWNLRTGQLLRTLSGHSDYVSCLAISSDNQTLVSGSNDQTIKVWNLRTGQLLRNLEPQGYSNGVGDVAVSLDGQTLVSSDSSDIKLWNLRTGQLLRTLEGHKFPVRDLVMSSKGETFASGSLDGSAKMWNLRTGQLLNNFPHGSGEPTQSATTEPVEGVYAVAISPDSQTLITGSGGAENSLKIWKVRTAEVVRTLKGHSKAVFSLVMSPDGQTIYSGSMDGTIKVWRSP
jgi:WD40 repeat protein